MFMSETANMPSILSSPLRNPTGLTWLALLATLAVAAAILIHFYDGFWWPPDDGAYAYVAARILAGDVLNRDVQDVHMGYINFFNAIVLWVFDEQFVSLRLPLVAAGILQAGILFLLFQSRGAIIAMTAATALTALSFVQFLNPTPHWYALFMVISIVGCLCGISRESRWRLFLVGLLLMTLFLFRQLSGLIVGIGVVAYLLFEAPKGTSFRDTLLARTLTVIMIVGLAGYLLAKTDATAILLFGIWPLAVMVYGLSKANAANREIARQLSIMLLGALVAAAPMFAYHLHHGSFGTWYTDTVLSALSLSEMSFISRPRHLNYALFGIVQIFAMESFDTFVNGWFWLSLVLVSPALGILFLVHLIRNKEIETVYHPLPFLAIFYAPVSAHLQIPIYLFFTVGLSLAGLLWMLSASTTRGRWTVTVFALFLTVTGLFYHAAQPLSRGLDGIIKGVRTALVSSAGLNRTGLRVEADDVAAYLHISELVSQNVSADQTILAIPVNPEIYFITKRRSPFRFFSSALGLNSKADLADAMQIMKERPPKLVFHRPKDKYNTALSDAVMAYVRKHYAPLESQGGFDIYRYEGNTQ